MTWMKSSFFWVFVWCPTMLLAVTLPSASLFPMRVGLSQELTNTKGEVLRWEVTKFVILNDEDNESDVRIEWHISHTGSFSFGYRVGFVVTMDGEVYVDSLSDGWQTRSFFPRILLLDATGRFVEGTFGEGISLVKASRLGRFTWGKTYPEVVAATLVFGAHRFRLLWDRSSGLIGMEGETPYYPK
ncbi:MAG: hypothetical protein N2314_07990 [Brevinematales bacterium]|nr:hypothetical protein [Brevinematales bacterium]